ncbi:MAG: VOC family protein [Hyphomonadaceae bacterium]|nr:VOC family protein [Hyphomonadaceae bacterium]
MADQANAWTTLGSAHKASFSFTKLVVDDLEKSAAFYKEVLGLEELMRVDEAVADRPISEILFKQTVEGGATFALFKFLHESAPAPGEVILGFVTPDLEALLQRATKAGGKIVQPIKSMPQLGIKVAFVADVEGRLLEVVQMLG